MFTTSIPSLIPALQLQSMQVWKLLQTSLQQDIPAMLLYVLESNGSSPGRQGFSMAVNAAGEMAGSIGGGIMEHKFVEMAKQHLHNSAGTSPSVKKQVHDKKAAKDQSGMICSGDQTMVLYPLRETDGDAVAAIIGCLEAYTNGRLELSPSGLMFSEDIPATNYSFNLTSPTDWLYVEKLGYKNHLHIIGGGHCALAFSQLMSGMDFYIHLYDDRQNLHTIQQNNYVHEKTIVDDYTQLKDMVTDGKHHYVVVMTFGYRTDDLAIQALLEKSFTYFGVLGSAKKIEKLFSDYIAEGISEALIQNIHAPIGLPIHSHTPQEIAVSIAAEIIQVKNQ